MTFQDVRRSLLTGSRSFVQSWWAVFVIFLLVSGIFVQRWQFTHPRRVKPLANGEKLPVIELTDLSGKAFRLDWRTEALPTALYIFSPTCKWCAKNLKAARAVPERPPGVHLVGVSVTPQGLVEYLKANSLAMHVYVLNNPKSKEALRIAGTPETILVGQTGVVQNVWLGVWSGERSTAIGKLFGVKLPPVDM